MYGIESPLKNFFRLEFHITASYEITWKLSVLK